MSTLACPLEIKFASNAVVGSFEGYASVYGVTDAGGDSIAPGAFSHTLAERKAAGRSLPMYMQHGQILGADPRPVGVWDTVEEDGQGLKVAGHLVGLDTETGRYNYALVKEGAMQGLSIGYRTMKADYGKRPGEPRRTIKQLKLGEISIVDDPMLALARMTSVKSASGDEIDAINSLSDAESFLREVGGSGWSKKTATDFVGRLVKIARREAGDDQGVSSLLEQIRSTRKLLIPTS
jgi:HK97 family phage prohead protease